MKTSVLRFPFYESLAQRQNKMEYLPAVYPETKTLLLKPCAVILSSRRRLPPNQSRKYETSIRIHYNS